MSATASRLVVLVGLCLGISVSPVIGQEQGATHAVGMLPVDDFSPEVRQAAQEAVTGPNRVGKNGPMAKVGHELALLYYQHAQEGPAAVRALRSQTEETERRRGVTRRNEGRTAPRAPQGRLRSPISADGRTVRVTAVAAEDASGLQSDLQAIGMERAATAGNVVSGALPISALEEAAALSSLRGLFPSYARTSVGTVESEADTAHRALQARIDFGVDGSGEKICALSDSYDQDTGASTSAADDVASGDLPGEDNPEGRTTPVDVLQDDVTTGSDEGRAMLQLIHDIAPGAELGFHTAFGGLGIFASGIQELANAGCTVIVDDVIFLVEPFFQDGPVAQAVDDVVTNDDVAYFSSTGNSGQNSYEDEFRDSGLSGIISSSSVAHDFDPASSTDIRQEITINEEGSFRISSFQWADPSAIVDGSAGADTDLDIALVNDTLGIVAESAADSDTSGNAVPFESLEFTNEGSIDTDSNGVADSTFSLVIEKAAGPDPDQVKYIYDGQDFTVEEFDTLGPTAFGHAMAEGAEAVAAAPFFNTAAFNENVASAVLESFSARGGIPILFDEQGNELSSPEVRQKPEVTGTDGIDNTFFGFDIDISDPDSDPNFFGTSAAAPNVAAIAGLVREADSDLAPQEVYEQLESTAADVTRRFNRDGDVVFTGPNDGEGVDDWSGFGFVQADEAIPSAGPNEAPTASSDDVEVDEDTVGTVAAPGVLENDTDPDDDSLSVVVVAGDEGGVGLQKTLPSGALATLTADGSLTYDPNGAFDPAVDETATDTLTYTATDGNGGTDETSVVVTINGTNAAPAIATNEGLLVGQGETAFIRTEDLSVSDDQSSPSELTFTVTEGPSRGILRVGGTEASSFTQQDLEDQRVEYTHTASTIERDRFNFTVSDSLDVTTSDTFRIAVSTDVAASPSRSFPDPSDSTNYQLVALPGEVDLDLAETLGGEPGPDWRAFREVGAAAVGGLAGLNEYDGSTLFNFRPGRGFWVIAQEDWTFEDTVTVVERSIPLQGGWNAISNPLGEDLAWTSVQDRNGIDEPLWRWDAGWQQTDTLRSARSGEAFYVFNEGGTDSLDLLESGTGGQNAQLAAEGRNAETDGPRTIDLAVVSGTGQETTVTVGMGAQATADHAPPNYFGGEGPSLRVVADDSEAEYVRKVVAADDGAAEPFSLRLRAKPETNVTVEARGLTTSGQEASSLGAVLVEVATGRRHNLRKTSNVSLPTGSDGKVALQVHLGRPEELQQVATPEETKLLPNYPNPFRGRTTLEFALAEPTDIQIEVYNVLGQQVATVEQGARQAGMHQLEWEARSLSSGTYFVRLTAGGTTDTRQITIVR